MSTFVVAVPFSLGNCNNGRNAGLRASNCNNTAGNSNWNNGCALIYPKDGTYNRKASSDYLSGY